MEHSFLKFTLFPEFIKYLLDKIFLVQLTFLHTLSQSTAVYIIILLIVFSPFLPSQFTSYLFVMPCLRLDLSTGHTNKDIVLGDVCPTGRYNLQKAVDASFFCRIKLSGCKLLFSSLLGFWVLAAHCDSWGYAAEMETQVFTRGDVA